MGDSMRANHVLNLSTRILERPSTRKFLEGIPKLLGTKPKAGPKSAKLKDQSDRSLAELSNTDLTLHKHRYLRRMPYQCKYTSGVRSQDTTMRGRLNRRVSCCDRKRSNLAAGRHP